jgi:predicted Rossmann fold nucleotide-binding protein DprA/Smf involved in DNA uptake
MRSGDSLAAVLLASRLVGDGLQPLKAAEFWRLCDQVGPLHVLLGQTEAQLTAEHGLAPDLAHRVASLLGRATAVAFELERLDQSGISTVTPFDEGYPPRLVARLRAKAPPLLHAAGDLDLLRRPGLGVVGSRDVSPEGAEVAREAGERGARLGLPLISGGARGVDQAAMDGAYQAGGSVVGFLADSLVRTLRHPDVRRAVHRGAAIMCTPYGPDAPFRAGNAMGRTKLVYAQSLATLVVAADADRGGTWSGAVEALTGGHGRVAVWRGPGEGPGNRALESRGAIPVDSIDDLEPLLLADEPEPEAVPQAGAAAPSPLFDA